MESRVRIWVDDDCKRHLFVVDLDKTLKEFYLMLDLKFENFYGKGTPLFYP